MVIIKKISLLQFYILFFILLANNAHAGTSLSISDEAFGNNIASRANADSFDDAWAASLPTGAFRPDLFLGGSGLTGSKSFTDPSGAAYQIDWEIGIIDQLGPGTPTSTSFLSATGFIIYGPSNTIQSNAPNPYPAETRLSTNVAGTGLEAIRFDFTSSPTDIYTFGVYIGDLESRPNNGTVGRVIIYDMAGIAIGDHPIIFTGTVKTNGADIIYTVTEPTGAPSGPVNNDAGDWGNKTTVFLSIHSDEKIGQVVIHVGDDDHTVLHDGASEQLGVAGFQLPASPYIPPKAVLTANKSVNLFNTNSYAVPGEDVIYSINVKNEGNGQADNNTIFIVDNLPDNLTFFNGDMDGAGPANAAIYFIDNGSALTFDPNIDVKYSNATTAPTNMTQCNYSPQTGYDAQVKHICFNPKGTMAHGTPAPEFTLQFRARIN